MGEQKERNRQEAAFVKLCCPDIHFKNPYWSEDLDEDGHGIRMFQRYSREEDDPFTESFFQVKDKIKQFLDVASEELKPDSSSDEERKMLAVGRLYAALHYETEVRRWAARARQVQLFQEEPAALTEDFQRFSDEFRNPPWIKIGYWMRPVVVFFFCFASQSFMLHLATRAYIHYMDAADQLLQAKNVTLPQLEAIGEHDTASLFEAQLPDYVTRLFADIPFFQDGVPLWLLDLSGALPAFLFLVTYVSVHLYGGSNIGLWTKTFIVASLMALMKGSIDLITIIPDSAGWKKCQARLGDEDLEAMRSLDFRKEFLTAMAGAIYYEIFGGAKGRIRYCADMLISGHTYFAVLFSLSAYSMIRYVTVKARMVRYAFFWLFTLCIATEILLVAGARFHYAVDMVLSVILVLTLWDSAHIETFASRLTLGYEWCNEAAGLKTFFLGGGYGRQGKELWQVDSQEKWKESWQRNRRWVLTCPKFEIVGAKADQRRYAKRRGDELDCEPDWDWYPVKVCASVEPWRSTKLIDLAYCQNLVLEDPDGAPHRPQDRPLKSSEPNIIDKDPAAPLVMRPGQV